MSGRQSDKAVRSSVFDLPSNIVSALIYIIPAAFSFIPIVGYFAWIIPMALFLVERRSDTVRLCSAQGFCIGLIRLVFAVIFDSIRNTALRTYSQYGQSSEYISMWGSGVPGQAALIFGNVFAFALLGLSLFLAVCAYFNKPVLLPGIGNVSEFMTNELNPKPKH